MAKPQFEIKTLLAITAMVAFALTFATQIGGWAFAFLLTVLLGTVTGVIVALVYFVFVPLFGKNVD